ncbi:MAG: hypothetical protein J6D54_13350, partial [Olsenella sp.]|nr:hypothetical protein [Olsenella sp.]
DRTFGAITRGRTPDEVAAAIRDVCGSWTPERSAALRDHVERTCSWAATVRALESAFERAPGRD